MGKGTRLYPCPGTVYNVYVGGTLSGNPSSPVHVNTNTTYLYDIYHNTNESNDYATKLADLSVVVTKLNAKTHQQYKDIKAKYNVDFLDVTIINNKLDFA